MRLSKPLLFSQQRKLHLVAMFDQGGIRIPHFPCKGAYQLVEKGLANVELVAMTQRPSNDAPEHITAGFVAWLHTIGD